MTNKPEGPGRCQLLPLHSEFRSSLLTLLNTPCLFSVLTTAVMSTSSPTCTLPSLPGTCLSTLFTCLTQISIHFKSLFIYLSDFIFRFWPYHMACGILVPRLGIEPVAPAVEIWSLNHWTTRKSSSPCLNAMSLAKSLLSPHVHIHTNRHSRVHTHL